MRKNIASLCGLSVAALLSVFTACNKLSKSSIAATTDTVIVKSNVVVVDTSQYTLVSSATQLAQGTYVFLYKPSLADLRHNGDFNTGNIIIGTTGEGYLRKIISATNDVQSITLNTQQARLEDIFQQGTITFSAGSVAGSVLQYDFSNTQLTGTANNGLVATSGSLTMNTVQNYVLQFRDGSLTNFYASCDNGSLSAHLQLNATADAAGTTTGATTLKTLSGTTTVWVKNIPLVITNELTLNASSSCAATGAVNDNISVTNNEQFSMCTTYSGGAWVNNNNIIPASVVTATAQPGAPNLTANCDIIPLMNVKFYGVTGSSLMLPLKHSIAGNRSATTADWDFMAGVSLQPAVSEVAAVLGYSLPDYNTYWNTEAVNYVTPYQVLKISGDNQTGTASHYLPAPIVVRVIDNSGTKQAGVPVYFTVTSGGGSLSYYNATTDANGIASGYWQLGNSSGAQTVAVTVKKANGTQIPGSPVVFTAN